MLSEFDVGMFSLNKDHTTFNFPGKVLGYLVQGIPVLGSVNKGNDLQEIIHNAEAGFVSLAGDDKALEKNAIKLLELSERLRVGKNAKKLLHDKFSLQYAYQTILSNL